MNRYMIFRPKAKSFLCIVTASSPSAAIRACKQGFDCPRGTIAIEQPPFTRTMDFGGGAKITPAAAKEQL